MVERTSRGGAIASLLQRLTSERFFLTLLGIALALPLLISRGHGDIPRIGAPTVTSGDEPHYLVMLNSLLDDGDLDLKNNYDAARRGSGDVGALHSGEPLERQVGWYLADGSWHVWSDTFEYKNDPRRPDGFEELPSLKPGVSEEFTRLPQYQQHPPGLAFLLAPFLWPFRGTPWVEHLALTLSALATFGTALFLRQLLRLTSNDAALVNAATLLAVLGSPLWHYSRMLFTEPWLTLFAVGALALAARRRGFLLAGCFIALGVQLKPPFALLAVPIALDRLLARDLKRTIVFSLPVALSAALVLVENRYLFGSPLRSAQPWYSGNPLVGIAGSLLSWNHGLIAFCPAVLVAAFGWRALWRTQRRLAGLCLGMTVPYFLLMCLWRTWWAGYCYGPRLIAPIIPFLFLGSVEAFASVRERSAGFRRFVTVACALSLLIGAAGGLAHPAFWSMHPIITPVMLLLRRI